MLSRRHLGNFTPSLNMFTSNGRMFMMQAVKDGGCGQVRFRECIGGKTTIGTFSRGAIMTDDNTANSIHIDYIVDNTRIQRYFTLRTGIKYRIEFDYYVGDNALKKVSYYTFDVIDAEIGLCKFNEPIDGAALFIYNGEFYEALVSQDAPDISCVTGIATNAALIGHCTISEEFLREKSARYRVDFKSTDENLKITFNAFTCHDNMVPTLVSTPASWFFIDKSNNLFKAVQEHGYSNIDIEQYSVGEKCGTVTNISRIQKISADSLCVVKVNNDTAVYKCISATYRSYMLENLSTHEILWYECDTCMLVETKKQLFERIDGSGGVCRYFPKNEDGKSIKIDKIIML